MIDKIINTVICGDAREKLKELPAGAVSCIITSPPYWALRDYGIEPMKWTDGWTGCLGLEPTIELYLKHLVGIFDEAKRVLRDDGCCFVNLGDTYAQGGKRQSKQEMETGETKRIARQKIRSDSDGVYGRPSGWGKRGDRAAKTFGDVPTKSLCLIPFRFAIAMVNHGWILRNTIIWSKPNPMPSSAKDRFTVDFEYVFFFVKSSKTTFWVHQRKLRMTDKNPKPDHIWVHKNTGLECGYQPFSDRICKGKKRFWNRRNLWEGEDYWFEPQYEECLTECNAERPRMGQGQNTQYNQKRGEVGRYQRGEKSKHFGFKQDISNPLGRNKRTTWTIPTEAFPEAHFATFPRALVEPMIKCGCPEFVCPKCGKARVKVYEPSEEYAKRLGKSFVDHKNDEIQGYKYRRDIAGPPCTADYQFKGYTSCSCNAGYELGIVMDFFAGSGTVGKVAAYLRRNYILIDAKKEYCQMAEERIAEPETGVPVKEQRQGQQGLFE